MTTLEELERRVAALEADAFVRAVAALNFAITNMHAETARGFDRVEEELGGRFDVVDRHLDEMDQRLGGLDERMEVSFTQLSDRLAAIPARLPEPGA